ncbi:MAG: bifunctional alpha,alpha-trehalose-phosphate synthase (UDP-forming)/trehalose-phosphatase [Bacteroidales bacterium]|nr:bifunctional alpha,alpha-trehalose-phosphate synthase (UDP-forming)/trehalose-phosphatase [Bacteroidales bacterium]MBN2819261.1 bifunctional alpha,alpha-trehalose-phosphate synthase (UDP-forming)/trehalose-phosphatase [Bacteroidales bacterium]
MNKVLIISNRLPIQIKIKDNEIEVNPSVGGLATGMKSVYKQHGGSWIGWPGLVTEEIDKHLKEKIVNKLNEEQCIPVFLENKELEEFYDGYSNKTIWPLFHYFMQFTEYNFKNWQTYVDVNQKYADVILENADGVDTIWIHDYHFLLLPNMIKQKRPDINVGFFLHIPFPSFEVFRILPWRIELIEGMLGADLIGFHTYDYERHFLSCVRRLLGHDVVLNQISLDNRIVKVDAFPMGIDYDKFQEAARDQSHRSIGDKTDIRKEIEKYLLSAPDRKLILSIDRLDYSKGIPNRLRAFEHFLEKYPQYRGKITLVMLAVPSRISVEHYKQMKSEVDELVGKINGGYASINWTPVWYFYRSMSFESLIELYNSCDIALLTPIRDGMNLVAKEYIASRTDNKGVLILSEMAGAAKEMSEAIIINPNNFGEIANAIKEAIEMPVEEQNEKIKILQKRLQRYNVEKWAQDFMSALQKDSSEHKTHLAKKLSVTIKNDIIADFKNAKKKILFLDYDGTLVAFKKKPSDAFPDEDLFNILDSLGKKENTDLVLISGRDKETFNKWFGDKSYNLVTDHGVWFRRKGMDWKIIEQLNSDWKEMIYPYIEFYVDRTPGTFIEEKNYSLVWHYRNADPELGIQRAMELKDELTSLVSNYNLEIMEGNKVIEIKNSGINKGRAANHLLSFHNYDYIMAIGDDWTDEFMFEALPKETVTIKVGLSQTLAKYNINSPEAVRIFLKSLIE